jgi:hypothetical protein
MNELKKYLTINSLFSAISGAIMVLFPNDLNTFFNVSISYIFSILGINLLIFALIVGYVAQKQLHNKSLVNLISGLDGLWVVGSLGIIIFQLFDLSQNGYIAIGLVAIWIGFLGYKQFQNNKKEA